MQKLNLIDLDEPTTGYSIKLYESVHDRLNKLAKLTGISKKNLVRHAINKLLLEEKI